MIKKAAWFVFFALMAVSCLDTPDCYNLNNNIVGISFRKLADGKADTVGIYNVSAGGTDSIFYELQLATGISLPVNYLQNQTDFTFQMETGVHVLSLSYSAKAQYVSEECGERYVVSGMKLLNADFDSTRVVSTSLTNPASTNIIVYRCPITNYVKFSFRQLYADTVSLGYTMNVPITGITDDYSGTVFYPDDTTSAVRLPLNIAATSTQYNFDFADGTSNTITLDYKSYENTLFSVCGPQKFYGSLTIQNTDFDKYKIVTDTIQDPPLTNIAILKCPQTNLVGIAFKASTSSGARSDTLDILSITDDYSGNTYYADSSTTSLILPLNTGANSTTFLITLEDGSSVKTLTFQYTRTSQELQEVCDPFTIITGLSATASGFTVVPITTANQTIKFPPVTNVSLVNTN